MPSVCKRLSFIAICLLAFFVAGGSLFAENTIVRAAYKGGLVLQEEPPGTILAEPAVCLPKDEGAQRYDYKTRLAATVAKARTRMAASILGEKSEGYRSSVAILDRNIALLAETLERLERFEGAAYILPSGEVARKEVPGAKFEGKCARALQGVFGHPDAFGVLNVRFEEPDFFVDASPQTIEVLDGELPRKLKEFAALESDTSLSARQKEERFGKLTEEVMAKVGEFMLIHPEAAATVMPREFGPGGTRVAYTPTITSVSTGEECVYVAEGALLGIDVRVKGRIFNITVSTPSVTHTFRKCIPEKYALKALQDALAEKKELLQDYRADFAKRLVRTEKEAAGLQKRYPQYFGD